MIKKGLITTGFHIPYNPRLKDRARKLRSNMTKAEKKLWCEYLRIFPFRVLRQKPLDNYIVDFYCPRLRLVIEVDGNTHDGVEARRHDDLRTAVLQGYGLRVIRFTNHEVLFNFQSVRAVLEGVCATGIPPAPL